MKNLFIVFLFFAFWSCSPKDKPNKNMQFYLYVGAYTQGEEEGIAVYRFDASDGKLEYLSTAKGVVNPSYLAVSADKNLLFSVNEVMEFNGTQSGAVSSFAIDPANGGLEFLNQVGSGGGAPCYISIDKSTKYALVANYGGGNISVFPILKDGKLDSLAQLEQHEGLGPNADRQEHAHAHSIILDNNQKFALAADLGIDKVISYKIDDDQTGLTKVSEFRTEGGAGPRHITFHQNGKFVFFINELNFTITSCNYDAMTGELSGIATISTLPDDFDGSNSCADIHISKDGRFLYGSNRGHDSIAIFEIDQQSGSLRLVGHQSVKGKTPRNFMIDPTGNYLLVANQNSNNIVVFKIDADTGLLHETGVEVAVQRPVCLKMLEIH
jgi:6-phosphogluconolactonase